MGYRSDFIIALQGNYKDLIALDEWLIHEGYSGADPNWFLDSAYHDTLEFNHLFDDYSRSQWLCHLISLLGTVELLGYPNSQVIWLICQNGWKCYGDFDEVVHEFLGQARIRNINFAYARVGDDVNDSFRLSYGHVDFDVTFRRGDTCDDED